MATARGIITGRLNINILLAFVFGAVFLCVMFYFSINYPNPTPIQIRVFMTTLSLAAAGIGGMIAGVIEVKYQGVVRAGGGMALFVIVWFSQPLIENSVVQSVRPPTPSEPVALRFLAALDKGDPSFAYSLIGKVGKETLVRDFATFDTLYKNVRQPIGPSTKRVLIGINSLDSPSGYPIGLYDLLTFRTKFDGGDCRMESVSVRADQTIQWDVFGYQISSPMPCT